MKNALLVAGCLCFGTLHAQPAPPARIDFESRVHPVIAARCLPCHSQEKRSGGLSLATYDDVLEGGRSGAAVRPGNSKNSLLMHRILGETKPQMPLGGSPLADSEIAAIRTWIDEGARATPTSAAAAPKWEAPLELEKPQPAPETWPAWSSPVDRYVAAYLAHNGIREPQLVEDRAFARRAYLDVWGLLPPPEELHAFLADTAPDKREKLVARLLTNKGKYAENWMSFWNDLLRNDEGVNYFSETASRKSISDWLLSALESDLPYDRFVYDLLNPSPAAGPEGFLIGVNWRGVVSASQTPAMQAAQNTAQIFLGINLKCNSCHDSFISKWKLRDAYSLAAYFSPDERLQLYRCDVAQQKFAEPAFLFPELSRVPKSNALADRRSAAAAIFTDPRDGRLARTLVNRMWERLVGHGLVDNPDEMDGEPWSPELLDWLANDFVEHNYDLKHLLATIITSRAYQMPAVAQSGARPRKYEFRGPEVRRLSAEQFADAIGAITGDWHVYKAGSSEAGTYSREWHVAANALTRALGRPIRDQVYSTRDSQATTLQALELVNGETLTHWLLRGARNMLGELPPEPVSAFDKRVNGQGGPFTFDVDVSSAQKLWLLVQDTGSYSPEKIEAVWANVELAGSNGAVPLATLRPLDDSGLRSQATSDGVRVKTPSRLIYDITGRGFTRIRGSVALENREITSELNPHVRFFLFTKEPDMERLTPVAPETPLPRPPLLTSAPDIVNRVFWYALGRAPSADEKVAAETALHDDARPAKVSAEGLADLLWAVMMKPEFQLVY